MIELSEILGKIVTWVGVRGIIIVILLGVIGIEAAVLKVARTKNETLQKSIATMKAAVEIQNTAIDDIGKKKIELQASLDALKLEKQKIKTVYVQMKDDIQATPLKLTCSLSMDELKTKSIDAAKRWNK